MITRAAGNGLSDRPRRTRRGITLRVRKLLKPDRRRIGEYLVDHPIKRLHVGCGKNVLPGWLNTDAEPFASKIVRLDATREFPFDANTFDYAFSEHMIEHIDFADGVQMLSELHRVLRRGGKLRISTPDLRFLVDLCGESRTELQEEYVRWFTEARLPDAPYAHQTFVLNHFVRGWGHKFIYDEEVLRRTLEGVGFVGTTRCSVGESADEELRNLENDRRMPPGHLALESLVLEAVKP